MKLKTYLKKYWLAYLFAIICLIVSVGLDMLSPQVTKKIIDDVIGKGNLNLLTPLLITIFMIGIGRGFFQYFKELTFDKVSVNIATNLRRDLFRHVQSLSLNYFDKTNTGELMSRIKDDVDRIWNGFGYVGMLMIEVVFHTVFVMYCMLNLSPKLAIIPFIAMPTIAVFAIYMEKKLDTVYEDISEENALLNTVAQENLAGVRTVKAFAREKFEIDKFLSHNRRYYELNMKQSKVFIRYQPIFDLITKLLPIVTICYGGHLVIQGEISLGTLGAFVAYCDYIVWPMQMLGWLSNDFASAIASIKKVNKIYKEHPTITDPQKPVILDNVKGRVTFDHVSLSISDTEILKDISFDLLEGKTLGVMGATGAGKTSIISLLNRFYDTTEGSVLLDGVDVRKLSLKQLRSCIAPVMQDVFLFSDTINENVKLGKRELVTDKDVTDSLDKAQAMEFISHMQEGCETLIGERGVGLSGGQKQRISIARALSKRTPILVMDDSTSALDMETELAIQQELKELKEITKIIIAHRISAVRHADEIIVLKDGQIAERGNHEELLKQKGMYYDTFMAQYGEYLEQTEQPA